MRICAPAVVVAGAAVLICSASLSGERAQSQPPNGETLYRTKCASCHGRDVIVIGNKSGIGDAMDPDRQGEILWGYRAGKGSALGGIEWGAAIDDTQAYFRWPTATVPRPAACTR